MGTCCLYWKARPYFAKGEHAKSVCRFVYHVVNNLKPKSGMYLMTIFNQKAAYKCANCGTGPTNNDLSLKFDTTEMELCIPLCGVCHLHGILPYRSYSLYDYQFFELQSVPIVNDLLRICELYEREHKTTLNAQVKVVY
jgi:hypothetical protein